MYQYFIVFLSNFFILKISIPLFKKYLLDEINDRSSHLIAKPRGGGIFLVLTFFLFCIIKSDISFIFAIPLSVCCFIDDFKGLNSKIKFATQVLTFSCLFFFNIQFYSTFLPLYLLLPFFLVYILFGSTILNFVNFMDGIDGLISGSFLIIFSYIGFFINKEFLIVVPCLIAFLYFNWQPSKIFLGDVGSVFIGYLFFKCLISLDSLEKFAVLVLVTSPLLLDPLICLLRRFFAGRNIFRPHKDHLYQRLNQGGISHANVSLLYMASIIFLIFSYELGNLYSLLIGNIIILIAGIYIERNKAVPFLRK